MQAYEAHKTNGGVRDCGRFFLDVVGRYGPEDVTVEWRGAARTPAPPVDQLIEQTWQQQTALAVRTNRRLFNGSLCRLHDCAASGKSLHLTLGPVDFKTFLATNLTHAHLRYQYGPEILGDALGVSASLMTADGFLLLGRRSQQVFYHAGRIHPIGGVVEPSKEPGTPPCPFRSMIGELTEETGLEPSRVRETVCLGMVRDKHIVQPELIFDVAVDADVAELRRGAQNARDRMEHVELLHVRNHPSSVIAFIEANTEDLTGIALASLLLHGLRHWGTGWFATARGYLRSMY